ncbi:hypothetical protein CSZ94_12030 [Janthinobacterium sp. ROICE36]|uniref:hypothetical protein n=1 Tax=Janthinobacterium sp. ROICE36 TaxID=2048670 RepID=UPI000C7F540C|nr:hypothetical protein [Janthinobacterium sp. ROICE36]PLY42103.1 hypothetical protein CSZ94_12030 [Janthinobacterium sp. ROICE36]
MKTKIMAVTFVLAALTVAGSAHADDYKKNYCSNQAYVAGASKYPHLHCDKDFFVYSSSSSKHTDMARGDVQYCSNTRAVLDEIKALGPTKIIGYNDVLNDTLAFARVYCKKE